MFIFYEKSLCNVGFHMNKKITDFKTSNKKHFKEMNNNVEMTMGKK